MKARIFAAAVFATAAADASATIKALSRANCVAGAINESVTYDRPQFNKHWMTTYSAHTGLGAVHGHTVAARKAFTWRSYAGDQFDRNRNTVTGTHLFVDEQGLHRYTQTIATDCNLGEW
ncbi:hypothetical protein GCM10009552_24330 [Rothia nasimurium]|uniref:Uncharacterized protein n=1 Tax=Luteibacter anthropi TaxID=564369 RepID=A0A7X5U9K0_9GAMM|nr:hypothetical protein [Luteibacter anthropi]NII06405.1 hypothetical protein [Luteibacter anthropi]